MAKLIDRDPTQEMIDTGREALNLAKRISADEIPLVFSYMYDAAPEIQKNPVAWMIDDDGDVEYNGVDRFSCGRTGGVPLYTFPPDAQAEIAKRDERIAELEQDLQTTADALGHAHQDIERLERESSACDLLEEQKGTIKALNWALGGEESTSTGNLIDAHEVDYAEEGLILLCRKLTQENVRLEDVVLFQKKAWTADFEELERIRDQIASQESSPITEEVEDIRRG